MTPFQHTPEPWDYHLGRGANRRFHIQMKGGFQIAMTPPADGPCGEHHKANAQRIVACVNACAGLIDPATEIREFRAASRRLAELETAMTNACANAVSSAGRIQRLETALQEIETQLDCGNIEQSHWDDCLATAREALKESESFPVRAKTVEIRIEGGCAEVVHKSLGVNLLIRDFDNADEHSDHSEQWHPYETEVFKCRIIDSPAARAASDAIERAEQLNAALREDDERAANSINR